MASNLTAMASNLKAIASNLIVMASNPQAMASNLTVMASNLIAIASNLQAMARPDREAGRMLEILSSVWKNLTSEMETWFHKHIQQEHFTEHTLFFTDSIRSLCDSVCELLSRRTKRRSCESLRL